MTAAAAGAPELFRVETKLVQYVVAPDAALAVDLARRHIAEDLLNDYDWNGGEKAMTATALRAYDAPRALVRADRWDDCIPWGWDGDGNETTLEVMMILDEGREAAEP